jgi:hypothetical protein
MNLNLKLHVIFQLEIYCEYSKQYRGVYCYVYIVYTRFRIEKKTTSNYKFQAIFTFRK